MKKQEWFEAWFLDITSGNGKFSVICRGYYKSERMRDCLFPTVEEAKENLCGLAEYIGLE